ncbi:MAG: hypothetical protein IJ890_07730 [Clostridia bacterium]|nr:hypothetical protein [Clostridia bacterium]
MGLSRRKNAIINAFRNNQLQINRSIIPPSIVLDGRYVVNLVKPEFSTKCNMLANDPRTFIQIYYENFPEVERIKQKALGSKSQDSRFPLYNSRYDYTSPGPSCIRTYWSEKDFSQIQVTKLNSRDSLFQLSYFESSDSSLKDCSTPQPLMIVVVQIKDTFPFFKPPQLAYASEKLEHYYPEYSKDDSDLKYASVLANYLRVAQVYLRYWESGEHSSNLCTMLPLAEIGRNLKVYDFNFPTDD